MIYLFTTPSCPNCPQAKKLLQEKHIEYSLVDASQPEGLARARQYALSSVPSLVVTDATGQIQQCCAGIEALESYLGDL